MTRHPKTIPMELRQWALGGGDPRPSVAELLRAIEARRAALRTHGPAEVVEPLREALDRAAAGLSLIRDDLLSAAADLDTHERVEVDRAA